MSTDAKASTASDFDENKKTAVMDRFSRTIAELGVETMKNLTQLQILIIGLRGVGIETAKNLVLHGPRGVYVHDDEKVVIQDLGTNFYLNPEHVGHVRSECVVGTLAELNPYVQVEAVRGELDEATIKRFGAVIVTVPLAKEKLFQINTWCRANKVTFLLGINYGVTFQIFSDFGDEHVVTDFNGEPLKTVMIENITSTGIVTITDKQHGWDDGQYVNLSEVEGMEVLNKLEKIRIKRIYNKVPDMDEKTNEQRTDAKGNKRWRTVQAFNQFQLDLEDAKLRSEDLGEYVRGGLATEVRPVVKLPFRSLEAAIPEPVHDDLGKMMNIVTHIEQKRWEKQTGTQLHYAYSAIMEFVSRKGEMPGLHNADDAKAVVAIAREILEKHKALGEGAAIVVDEIEEDVVLKTALFARSELPGLTAFLGGVLAQEVVKRFGKYTPVHQFLYGDYFELLVHGTAVPEDFKPAGSRYDYQISILGKTVQDKILAQRWFLVGSGALGCEFLKAIALMGIGAGKDGHIYVTDMDKIELSNLARQFLFRQHHVGEPKAKCAAAVAKDMNPDLNLTTYLMKVGSDTEHIFTDDFWESLNGVWNALDNWAARLYTDSRCLQFGLPLLESGTEGTKCNSSVHVPHQTAHYGEEKVVETEGIPVCTLKTFPYMIEHCIEWAKLRFQDMYELAPRNFNTLLMDKTRLFAQAKAERHVGVRAEMLQDIDFLLEQSKDRSFENCIRLAFSEFNKQYYKQIRDLTYFNPRESRVIEKDDAGREIDMGPFWTGRKRFPEPAEFDIANNDHAQFMFATSNLFAFMFGLPQERDLEKFKQRVVDLKLAVPAWSPPTKRIAIEDEKKPEEAEADEDDVATCERLLKKFADTDLSVFKPLEVNEFEKDDDTNFHIDFMTTSANLRALNYSIKPASRLRTKVIAGRIIPALATTTALISGLTTLEFYKIVMGMKKTKKRDAEGKETDEDDFNPWYNTAINLGIAKFDLFEARDPQRTKDSFNQALWEEVKAVPSGFTAWDMIVVDKGDLTVGEFVKVFPEVAYGATVIEVARPNQESGDSIFANDEEKAFKAIEDKKLRDVFVAKGGSLNEKSKFLLLEAINAEDKDGNRAVLPVIKYVFSK